MTRITIGFKAFDPHELLCHFTAVRAGFYRDAGIDVDLVDLTFTPDPDMPEDWMQVSCGAALAGALRGAPQKVVFVAAQKPMFWLYGRGDIAQTAQLEGCAVATYPDVAPPAHFVRMLLGRSGVDVEKGVRLIPARDDTARLGLLRSGTAAGALISSALPPPRLEQMGFNVLAFVGDVVQAPTTGLAVHRSKLDSDAALVRTVVRILQRALIAFRTNPEEAKATLGDVFDVGAQDLDATFKQYAGCFTQRGTMPSDALQTVIENLSGAMGVSQPPSADQIYDFSLLQE